MRNDNPAPPNKNDGSVMEDILRQGGASAEEAKSTGTIARGDAALEATFGEKSKTTNGAIYKAFWKGINDLNRFRRRTELTREQVARRDKVLNDALSVVRRHKQAGTFYDPDSRFHKEVLDELLSKGQIDKAAYEGLIHDGKISEQVLEDLMEVGWFAQRIPIKFGGLELPFYAVMHNITEMAKRGDLYIGSLYSVHGMIGLTDPVLTYGTDAQKKDWLPELARRVLSGFAITEPGQGSDIGNIQGTAVLEGDYYRINATKLFITNSHTGRWIGLAVKVDGVHQVFKVVLPETENEHFHFLKYEINTIRRLHNYGLVFTDFMVHKDNLIPAPGGDGKVIIQHGLNGGRAALSAISAAGALALLRSLTPKLWLEYRKTLGKPLAERTLILKRLGEAVAMAQAMLALRDTCASMLDAGDRAEIECITAKVMATELLRYVVEEVVLKCHGGRSFLKGHPVNEFIMDMLAQRIFEGEGDVLSMAQLMALTMAISQKYMAPMIKRAKAEGIERLNPFNPIHAWKLRREILPLTFWAMGRMGAGQQEQYVPGMHPALRKHVSHAQETTLKLRRELVVNMVAYQAALNKDQPWIVDFSKRLQANFTSLITCLFAHDRGDQVSTLSAHVLAMIMRRQIDGGLENRKYWSACVKLGRMVVAGQCQDLEGIPPAEIMMQYEK